MGSIRGFLNILKVVAFFLGQLIRFYQGEY